MLHVEIPSITHCRLKHYAQYILYSMFFEKIRTMGLEYLETIYIPEVGLNKGFKLTPNYSTFISAFKVKMVSFFGVPEVPGSEVKLIL